MIIMLALLLDLISAAENSVSQLRPTLLFSSTEVSIGAILEDGYIMFL